MNNPMTSHQVSVAGEAYAACLFAQAGCDVLIQYGANQPGYDFVAQLGEHSVRVSVKATQLNGWGLIGRYKKGRTYHEAAEEWFNNQAPNLLFAFISFYNVEIGGCPRGYLASAREVANHHNAQRNGHGLTSLVEDYTPVRGLGAKTRIRIPQDWLFSAKRLQSFLK